ncbi:MULTISPECIES: type 1 glutamine amidotransferase domain-containing protein [unclassified Roseateles]|uniref:type 1 glutamine amidotransferase domain-containing protein n=1 Tax=Pelomonas sp. Root1237 TaxID=1736434 RepID=UPI000A8CC8BB|nr:type 1 glutamine amidotransferase domain-containing protein [Pelomonas sp. Root1237]
MARILIPLPAQDYDPSEAGIPWKLLTARGHTIRFATPDGRPAQADPRMLDGKGLGPWKSVLRADATAREAHAAMVQSEAFRQPVPYDDIDAGSVDALLLPGGHAPGMKVYLESPRLQAVVAAQFAADKPVAAICHGVLLAARSKRADGKSVLHGRRTTGLTKQQEMTAWLMTAAWLGSYYRTYPTPLQTEVQSLLASPRDFDAGPPPLLRDTPQHLGRGFTVRDGHYLSARWPGDAHAFAQALAQMLDEQSH